MMHISLSQQQLTDLIFSLILKGPLSVYIGSNVNFAVYSVS